MRVLLVRLSALGDVVHALPALERLRAALPDATLTWVSEPHAAPVLRGHPSLDELVVLERKQALRAGGALRRTLRGLRGLRGRFDAALDLQGLLRSALVARASQAPLLLGPAWAPEGARFLYRRGLHVPRPGEAHAVERAARLVDGLLEALGQAPPSATLPPARLPDELRRPPPPGVILPAEQGPLLALIPGAGKSANRLPAGLLAEIADRCASDHPSLRVVLVGGPRDAGLARETIARCQRARPRSLCGQVDLRTSAQVLHAADAVLGGDTGPLHLARALGRPLVALFHAAEPARTSPAGLPGAAPSQVFAGQVECAPCRARRCQRADRVRVCLDDLPATQIAADVSELLARRG